MNIIVNGKKLEVSGQRLLIEELREAGYDVPSLCYAADARHEPSCMVCMVRNEATDQMLPSCAIYPSEGMCIDATSDEVTSLRRMSLELLLSDHRADCEAPCTLVCPAGIDVAKVISYYDEGKLSEAQAVLLSALTPLKPLKPLKPLDPLPPLPCASCKANCEKACRRGMVDQSVSIRQIIQEVAQTLPAASPSRPYMAAPSSPDAPSASSSRPCMAAPQSPAPPSPSKLGRYSEAEKERLKEVYSQPSRCLHCACEGATKCKLREWATKAGIKTSPFGKSSSLPVKEQQHITGRLWYEPAKCIRCGLCVYNSNDGFTFLRRGFDMQIVIPEQSKKNVDERLAELCPTGALYIL